MKGKLIGDITCPVIIFIRLNELDKTHNFQVVTSERKKKKMKTISQELTGMEYALLRQKKFGSVENRT